MSDYKIPIPQASQEAFWTIWEYDERNKVPKYKGTQLQNAGLIFERYVPEIKDDSTLKEVGLRAVLEAYGNLAKPDKEKDGLIKAWNARWERLIDTADAKPFEMKTDWRLIAGLGRKGSLEVGFTFHRYGFPYLPGSSLKGLARAYGLLEIASLLEEKKLETIRAKVAENNHIKPEEVGLLSALDTTLSRDVEKNFKDEFESCQPSADIIKMAEAFRTIFGTTDTAGKAIFFDAIPYAVPKLELDIMNPHYPDYYNDRDGKQGIFPTNWQNPNPVKFLTVASGTVFRFAIGWRSSPQDNEPASEKKQTKFSWWKGDQIEKIKQQAPDDHPAMVKLARRWLEGGLLELGAGGKTSAGYGYFIE